MRLSSQLFATPAHVAQVVRSSLALQGSMRHVYNEASFRQVLGMERKRARFAHTSFFLLLVRIRDESGSGMAISRSMAAALFSGLTKCLREVDFVGWHREGRVAAAVLAQGQVVPGDHASSRIVERVTQALRSQLPLAAQHLDVRVVRLGRG
jgi:hypothetical protein